MKMHKYLWQVGRGPISGIVDLNKAPSEGQRLVDLKKGTTFAQTLNRVPPEEKFALVMAEALIHAWPVGRLSQQDLDRLRERAGYIADEYCQTDIVFET